MISKQSLACSRAIRHINLAQRPQHVLPIASNPYHTTSFFRLPYKDDQDRQSLKPRSTEGTKSGADSDMAGHSEAAFDPSKTSPEAAKDSAGKGREDSPLEVSGANQEMSKPQGDSGHQEKGTVRGEDKKGSGHGSPVKSGKPSETGKAGQA